ncbi:uncharacterized protein EAF01_001727 [Botrytis porri]|uniref:Tyrosine specific protein phosphatases domain-containing protein n=1 Tax=Botrytis porri TaxID=87229 RepID=A0A4Z1KMA2_9HELO|nr:uncharacterized protein EAF01_001727 [Botrytis porri]KAF7912706.1 hypothetical protein EAF01_001727 [Botrytis porri]TGO84724.1 hypothetical protein BPOR_0473g00080 [Botrytis porri]
MSPTTNAEARKKSNATAQDIASEAEKVGFHRWKCVTAYPGPYTLYRSSSPNYVSPPGDPSQSIDAKGIAFLHKQNIGHVICLNNDEPSCLKIEAELTNAHPRIIYTHLPVTDYTPPSLDQMETAYQEYLNAKVPTLVHCGYGHGRTGTMITALQYKIEKAKGKKLDFKDADYARNNVEKTHYGRSTGQYEMLNLLQGKK